MRHDSAIAFLIAYGPEMRAFVYSGLVERLARRARVLLVSASPANTIGLEAVEFPDVRESALTERLRGVSRRLRSAGVSSAATWERRAARTLGGSAAWRELFETHKVGAIVTASYASARTLPALQSASNAGIPTVTLLNSWKDVHAKPYAPAPPAAVGLCSRSERRRFLAANPDFEDGLFETGSLHLSAAARCRGRLGRADFCSRFGMDPARPLVIYSAAAGKAAGGEDDWIQALGEMCSRDRSRPQLLVRANPMGPERRFPAGVVWRPDWAWSAERDWCCPSLDDLRLWSAALDHMDACVCPPSTVTMELAYAGKPAINLTGEPEWQRLWNAPFFAEARRGRWATPITGFEGLERALRDALSGRGESPIGPPRADAVERAEALLVRTLGLAETSAAERAA